MPPAELTKRVVDGLNEDELLRARSVLSLPNDATKTTIANALEIYAEASLVEYLDQFLGRALPTRLRTFRCFDSYASRYTPTTGGY